MQNQRNSGGRGYRQSGGGNKTNWSELKCGALWYKNDNEGNVYTDKLSGNIEINGEKVPIVVFLNTYKKDGEASPDFIIYNQPDKNERPQATAQRPVRQGAPQRQAPRQAAPQARTQQAPRRGPSPQRPAYQEQAVDDGGFLDDPGTAGGDQNYGDGDI